MSVASQLEGDDDRAGVVRVLAVRARTLAPLLRRAGVVSHASTLLS